jgi:uncharacterized protein YbjT (DUF2867 family)
MFAWTVAFVACVVGVGHLYDRSDSFKEYRKQSFPNYNVIHHHHHNNNNNNNNKQYRAFVVGGTGAVGKELVNELLQSNDCTQVVTLTRRPINVTSTKLKQIVVDNEKQFLDHDYIERIVQPEINNFDVAFSAFGTTRKNAGSAQQFERIDRDMNIFYAHLAIRSAKIPNYSLVSTVGADANSWLLYPRCKGEIEVAIQKLVTKNDSTSTYASIFRPGALIADRQESRVVESVALTILPKLDNVLFVGPLRPYRSIPVQDVAKAMRQEFEARWNNSEQEEDESENYQIYDSDQIQCIAEMA